MGWQKEELEKRRTENKILQTEQQQLLILWHKILAANKEIPAELRAHEEKGVGEYSAYTWLKGRTVFCLIERSGNTTMSLGGFEARYSNELGLHFYYSLEGWYPYTQPITDNDIDKLLESLCSGDRSLFEHFERQVRKLNEKSEPAEEKKSFLSRLFGT